MRVLEADKIGSATTPITLTKTVNVIDANNSPQSGDVVAVRAFKRIGDLWKSGTDERTVSSAVIDEAENRLHI